MAVTFFPSRDDALLAWSLNFITLLTASPTTYGTTSAECTAYQALHDAYATALAACEPSIRSKSAVAGKNSARAALKNDARLLASKVYGQASVTDAQKLELGLTVRSAPTPIPAPVAAPKLTVKKVSGRTVTLQLQNADVTKRARPAGVQGASVFSHVGDTPPENIESWVFQGSTTKSFVDCSFPTTIAAGAKVWFCAFWYSAKALSGPACTPISTYLQFGGVSMLSEAA